VVLVYDNTISRETPTPLAILTVTPGSGNDIGTVRANIDLFYIANIIAEKEEMLITN
jgi:hypothetical protein